MSVNLDHPRCDGPRAPPIEVAEEIVSGDGSEREGRALRVTKEVHMRLEYLSAAVIGAALLAGCATIGDKLASERYFKMTGAEIAKALPGNSLDGEDDDGEYVIYYDSASTMRIQYRGRTESGVWRIDGDKYCRKWEKFGGGKERCVHFYRNGDLIRWVGDGEITDRSALIPGNPAGL